MTDATRDPDIIAKYFGANRNPDDRTMKQACERLSADAFEAGRKAAIEDAIEIVRSVDPAFMVQELEKLRR